MVWKLEDPQGDESGKVKYDVLPYTMGSLLDVGCGPRKLWPHAIGVDSMVDSVLFGIPMKPDIVVPDASRMEIFGDRAFNCVFSSHLLEHIEDHKTALAEWWRLVKVGGHLVLYLPHKDLYPNIGQPNGNPDHKHDFVPRDIIEAMYEVAKGWDCIVSESRDRDREYSFLQVYQKLDDATIRRESWDAPKPAKTAGIMRLGGHGDALWASSVAATLKDEGYHVTVFCARTGAEVLRSDPHIDRIVTLRDKCLTDEELFEFYAWEAVKHDKWVNLVGSVEDNLLPHPNVTRFYLPHELRHKLMNVNYLDTVHEWAQIAPQRTRQRFYPTAEETEVAKTLRASLEGPVVVIAPTGSGPVKYWPHAQRLMELLAERKIHSVVMGDVRDPKIVDIEPFGHVVGMEWPLRIALAYAMRADAVVATESVVANAVALEPMLKVITLSHSSVENLTRDWERTASIEPKGLKCYPCHRVHGADFGFCARDRVTGAAACQAMATPEMIAELVIREIEGKAVAAAA